MKPIKIILALLLLLCLAKMPYGYYQFVRFGALIGFALLAFNSYEKGLTNYMIVYIGLALLFQPFNKIALGREIWNIVDVVVAIWLLVSIKEPQKNR
jgi:hypothetical protein